MRYFYEPTASDTESERSVARSGSISLSSKAKGKQRAVELDPRSSRNSNSKSSPKKPLVARNGRTTSPSASTSSSSSGSDVHDSDDEDDEDSDDGPLEEADFSASDSDSEEEQFPVNPSPAEARRRLTKYGAHHDPLDVYHTKEQQRAWERAQASHNRDLVALRTIRLNAFAHAERARQKSADDELELVRLVLEDFDLRRQKEEERVDREFTERNTARWDEINKAISKLEQEATAAEQAKRKQQEAEEKARKLREEEEAKIRQEKEEKQKAEQERQQTAKAAEERAKKAKEEAERAAQAQSAGPSVAPTASASSAAPSAPGSSAADSVNYLSDAKAQFERWHAKVASIKSTVLPAISGNPSLKNACWKLKRSLSTRISNVSASASDIRETLQAIHGNLQDARGANEQAYHWCLNLLSKKIIEMAGNNSETDLSPVTYALAQVIVGLFCADHPDFAEIFMARLVKRCPYVIPYHPPRGQMSLPEYNKLVGRKDSEPGVSYKQRMSGIVSLYAAIVQTSPSTIPSVLPSGVRMAQHVPPYFRPEGGWRWLAIVVRPPVPLLDITALQLFVFLRMTGERFHSLFGKQYIKLLRAIAEQGIDQKLVKWNDGVQGDLAKVRLMIGDWMDKGQIKGADGRIPS